MRKKKIFLIILVVILVLVAVGFLPPIRERIAWRVHNFQVWLHYTLNPPEEAVFIPRTQTAAGDSQAGNQTLAAGDAAQVEAGQAQAEEIPLPTATIEFTPTPAATSLPESHYIEGVPYEDQHGHLNYCGPSNFSMELRYWGWEGDREVVGEYLMPENLDKNVAPIEMVKYVKRETELKSVLRYGGTVELLKRLVANDFPVLIEKGVWFFEQLTGREGWMGHYNVVIGYDDASGKFTVHDSYLEKGENYKFTYEHLMGEWQPFNYVFFIVYSPEFEEKLYSVLSEYADEETSSQIAADIARQELESTEGVEQFYAMFNLGTSLVNLKQYEEAAAIYDEAFIYYSTLPEERRPWRMMWYLTGPYEAYYEVERYQDVVDLATQTLDTSSDPYLEESNYWRFKAAYEMGDMQ